MAQHLQPMAASRPAQILMVDDNPGDARLMLEAMKEVGLAHQFHWLDDGEKAMAYLRQSLSPPAANRPDLILLDLNMPRKDGREILAEIKADASLRHIPVIILTTSQAEDDINHAYHASANCYINKPVSLDQFIHIVRTIKHFWFSLARLPIQPATPPATPASVAP